MDPEPQPLFLFDLGSPECWLAAERVLTDLPVLAEWLPVLRADLPTALPDALRRDEIAVRAATRGLLAPRWPCEADPDTHRAMLAATYAKQIGKSVAFALACFRQAYAAARSPGEDTTLLLAGAAAEIHPTALLAALETRAVARALQAATARAAAAGVRALPAILTPDGAVFAGDDGLEQAAAALAPGVPPATPTPAPAPAAAVPVLTPAAPTALPPTL